MKRIISLCLTIVLVCLCFTVSYANDTEAKSSIYEVALSLQEKYPDATITISNDTINVVLASENNQLRSNSNLRTDYYQGGSYRNFVTPSYWAVEYTIPYSMVFLPAEQTASLVAVKNNQSIFDIIIENLLPKGAEWVRNKIISTYNVTLPIIGIYFIYGINVYNAILWIDAQSLNRVVANSPTICITRTTTNGYPTTLYSPWDGHTVTPGAYELFNPTFYPGEYDVIN